MRSRRVFCGLAVVATLLASTVLVSCAPAAAPAPTRAMPTPVATPPTPMAVAAPPEPKVLVVAISGDIESLDVHQLGVVRSWQVAWNLYGFGLEYGKWTDPATGLTYATTDYVPGLLESWEKREEAGEVVYTCHIRKGCKFASGREMTSKDYLYRTTRMQELRPWNNTVWGCNEGADCVKVLDDYTFEWHIDQPNPVTDVGMRELVMMIVDSEELEKHYTAEDPWAHEYLRMHDLGVGAYRIDHITPAVEIVLVKNEDYCAPEYMHGYFDKIIFKIIPSPSDQMLLLKKGEVDIAPELPMKETLDLLGEPGVKVMSFPMRSTAGMGLSYQVEPFDNIKVRQALAYAAPRQEVIDSVFLGQGVVPVGHIPAGTVGYSDKYCVFEYDLDKAKALLAEAGYPDGFDMELFIDLSRTMAEDIAVLVKDSFAKIGVNVNIEKLNPAAYAEKNRRGELPATVSAGGGAAWTNDVGYLLDMSYTSWGFLNYVHFNSPELDQIVKDAWEVMDPKVRLPMYERAQEILCEQMFSIPLTQINWVLAMREDIEGIVAYPDYMPRYYELYREE